MKQLLPIVLLIGLPISLVAQTFIPLRITPEQTNAVLTVPTNTFAKFHGSVFNASYVFSVTYEGLDPVRVILSGSNGSTILEGVLGPCELSLGWNSGISTAATNWIGQVVVELCPVNQSLAATSPVVPAGMAATLTLETSTNLMYWQTMTNASFPKVSGNRFFRTSLSLP